MEHACFCSCVYSCFCCHCIYTVLQDTTAQGFLHFGIASDHRLACSTTGFTKENHDSSVWICDHAEVEAGLAAVLVRLCSESPAALQWRNKITHTKNILHPPITSSWPQDWWNPRNPYPRASCPGLCNRTFFVKGRFFWFGVQTPNFLESLNPYESLWFSSMEFRTSEFTCKMRCPFHRRNLSKFQGT